MRILFFVSLFFIVGCTTKQATKESSAKESTVQYAKHFRFVTEKNGLTALEIINPDTGETVRLQPFGDNNRVVALSGTFIGMMDKLKLATAISGVSEMKYIYNQTVKDNFKKGTVLEAGYDTQLSLEKIIGSKPAAILHSGYSKDFPHQKQFENAGIQCIPIFDWREESPLGRAEWIKVYGFLYGKEAEAQQLFDSVEKAYLELKETANKLAPSKLVISGNIMGSEWVSPAGGSFYAQLMKDANITYNYYDSEGTGSVMNTQEKILSENRNAAFWINPGASSLDELKTLNPKAVFFDAFKNKQVYCRSHNENYYWEISSVEPDKLLSDLIHITHGTSGQLYFYSQLK